MKMISRALAGYVLGPTLGPIGIWRCVVIARVVIAAPRREAVLGRPSALGAPALTPGRWPTRAVVRLAPAGLRPVQTLRPVRGSEAYCLTSLAACGLVTPELAEALEAVFARFAHERGFTPAKPLAIRLARGFKASSHGHGEGRAADIDAVGGKSLLKWKQEWDQAMTAAKNVTDPQQRAEALAAEQARNLGFGLYKFLQAHGGWRVNRGGWRVYRGVTQLFGPWTATEGPWKALHLEHPTPAQRQRFADQQWVFQAHQDHIHVAR
jgi:hypothetical protein